MARLKTIRVRLPTWVRCPGCHQRQPFRKQPQHWKLVKDLDRQQPCVLKGQVVYARCRNPACPAQSFALPTPGVKRSQRATARRQTEAVAGLLDDTATLQKTAARLNRSLNPSASKSALARWKHRAANQGRFRERMAALGFSGVRALDECKPTRSKPFDLIACEALRDRLLSLGTLPPGGGVANRQCQPRGRGSLPPSAGGPWADALGDPLRPGHGVPDTGPAGVPGEREPVRRLPRRPGALPLVSQRPHPLPEGRAGSRRHGPSRRALGAPLAAAQAHGPPLAVRA